MEKTPGATRQQRYQEKLRSAVKELEALEWDVRAAKRIILGALDGLKTIAVTEPNGPTLTRAINHIESALLLLDAENSGGDEEEKNR